MAFIGTCTHVVHIHTLRHIQLEKKTFKMDFMFLFVKVACVGGEAFIYHWCQIACELRCLQSVLVGVCFLSVRVPAACGFLEGGAVHYLVEPSTVDCRLWIFFS